MTITNATDYVNNILTELLKDIPTENINDYSVYINSKWALYKGFYSFNVQITKLYLDFENNVHNFEFNKTYADEAELKLSLKVNLQQFLNNIKNSIKMEDKKMTNNIMNLDLAYYDYYESIEADILNYIDENVNLQDYDDADEAYQVLYDEMYLADSVTGNASGSYWFSSWKAEKALAGNFELIAEAYQGFGYNSIDLNDFYPEFIDVSIRCHLLSGLLSEVLNSLYKRLEVVLK